MKVSRKSEYAMLAAVDLALHSGAGRVVSTSEIARRTATPPKFLEAILVELKRAGLVESRRGTEGGHRLARAASETTAGQVWRAIDGPLALLDAQPRHAGTDGAAARAVRGLWKSVEEAVSREVDNVTLAELARQVQEFSKAADFNI